MSRKRNKPARRHVVADDELAVLNRICRHLQILVGLNLQALGRDRNQTDLITMLDSAGCGQKEIADLLGTTPNTVNVALWKAKKRK